MLETEFIKIDPENIDMDAMRRAGEIIAGGGLVAFPTETVYGLGASAVDSGAAEKIYTAKGRPSDNPLIVHVCSFEHKYILRRDDHQIIRLSFMYVPLNR